LKKSAANGKSQTSAHASMSPEATGEQKVEIPIGFQQQEIEDAS